MRKMCQYMYVPSLILVSDRKLCSRLNIVTMVNKHKHSQLRFFNTCLPILIIRLLVVEVTTKWLHVKPT